MSTFKQYEGRPDSTACVHGAEPYLAAPELATAVNTALAAGQPLLVTGLPGTGKSRLAESVADAICSTQTRVRAANSVRKFHVRSDSRARDVLYTYDHMARFYAAQIQQPEAAKLEKFRVWGALGEALLAKQRCVVLIDEIDKAPTDFPNDLLNVIDRWELDFPETKEETIRVREELRPFVLITSNQERPLPQPFLRRCVFHHLGLPSEDELRKMVRLHFQRGSAASSDADTDFENMIDQAIRRFVELRDQRKFEWEKQPSTGELLAWIRVLHRAGKANAENANGNYWSSARTHLGVLVKTVADWNRTLKLFDESRSQPA